LLYLEVSAAMLYILFKIFTAYSSWLKLRYIFSEIQKRLLRHKNYRRVVANMKAQFPEATKEELEAHGMFYSLPSLVYSVVHCCTSCST